MDPGVRHAAPCDQADRAADAPVEVPTKATRTPNTWQRLLRALLHVVPTSRRDFAWFAVGLLVATGVALRDLGQLLGAIESSGGEAYTPAVFTGPSLTPWVDSTTITDAVAVWGADTRWVWWVGAYLWIAVWFALAGCAVLYLLMKAVGLPNNRPFHYATTVFVLGIVQTAVTATALLVRDGYWVIPYLSALTWLAVLLVLLVIVACWANERFDGPISLQRAQVAARRTVSRPALDLRWLVVLVGAFLAFIALPAGDPLEQLPDVLRAQLMSVTGILPAVVASAVLVGALLVAGWRATPPAITKPEPRTSMVLAIGAFCGAELAWIGWDHGSPSFLFGLTLPGVLLALVAADGLRKLALSKDEVWLDHVPAHLKQKFVTLLARLSSAGPAKVESPEDSLESPKDSVESPEEITADAERATRLRRQWIGGLAGAVVAGLGIGLLRAGFRPLVVLDELTLSIPWLICTIAGWLAAVLGGWMTQRCVIAVLAMHKHPGRVVPWLFGLVVVALGIALACWPSTIAPFFGTSGTFALCLALIALGIGELQHLARIRPAWPVTKGLGLGNRGPWLGILVTALLISGLLNTGAYHEIRVLTAQPDLTPTYPNIQQAWKDWRSANTACHPGQKTLPMLLVAAPGGGIRASYWTAAGLEKLEEQMGGGPCGRAPIFAISGVSGGSLGTVGWVQAPQGKAKELIKELSQDKALAATTAALFLRDLLQPMTGLSRPWRDRAAVMEDTWAEQAPALFGQSNDPRRWSQLRSQKGWTPAIILNGSSVSDGCRVLISNVGMLPTAAPDCRSATLADDSGAAPGTLDATRGLAANLGAAGSSCLPATNPGHGDIGILTAALLSARFPVVSPSGTLRRCLSTPHNGNRVVTTLDVDGGYYDNSGLLSLLAVWNAVEAEIRSCTECPPIEPWFVVLDNNYRSTTVRPPDPRHSELTVPLQTLGSALDATSEERLEQVAGVAMEAYQRGSGTRGHVERISPQNGPGVSAPLGLVLSGETQTELDRQLEKAFQCAQAPQALFGLPTANRAECLPSSSS